MIHEKESQIRPLLLFDAVVYMYIYVCVSDPLYPSMMPLEINIHASVVVHRVH